MRFETIKRKSEFNRIYRQGQRKQSRYFTIYALENDQLMIRAGISTGKYIGNAVVRNRIRRIIKELLRKCDLKKKGVDLLIIAKKESVNATYGQIKQSIYHALSSFN
ncbi:MAG: ribonuclease P protein component [Actinomycetota bacterium]|nr:ribonuclease P protein component [Actinomycetota bacterium]